MSVQTLCINVTERWIESVNKQMQVFAKQGFELYEILPNSKQPDSFVYVHVVLVWVTPLHPFCSLNRLFTSYVCTYIHINLCISTLKKYELFVHLFPFPFFWWCQSDHLARIRSCSNHDNENNQRNDHEAVVWHSNVFLLISTPMWAKHMTSHVGYMCLLVTLINIPAYFDVYPFVWGCAYVWLLTCMFYVIHIFFSWGTVLGVEFCRNHAIY